ncbi:MAG: glycosyltransferase [Rhodobacteraceae bacterium]|nr:glycosyltransferase [Paracoccaceae bacterium]
MTARPVSVIVVSRHRAAALRRCVTGIGQLDHPNLELIVVADPAGLAALGDGAFKAVAFDVPNISAARNLGLDQAAGEVVAFIDDDAVPEPTWLRRLVAPFDDPKVAAAGGFVRGRNGLSLQWRAMEVDRLGQDRPLEVATDRATVRAGSADRAVKTQGTNCAFRRATLAAIGGFDEALHFYLDEADVNLRLAAAGHLSAVVPGAEVHHGFAESARRNADRTPRTLFDISASSAVFLRRHAPAPDWDGALRALRVAQRQRLEAFRARGAMDPAEAGRLMATLEDGIAAGLARDLPPLVPRSAQPGPFRPLPGTGPRAGCVLAGRPWSRKRRAAEAERRAGAEIVTVLNLGPTARPHHARFRPEGYWEQTGGLFGRADRAGPRFALWLFSRRVRHEIARIGANRPTGAQRPP